MTNDNNSNVFKEFSDIITSFQDPSTNTTSTWYRPKSDNSNSNNGCCIQCNSPRKNTNFYPFCGAICKGAWNAAKADDQKEKKNSLLKFQEVLRK